MIAIAAHARVVTRITAAEASNCHAAARAPMNEVASDHVAARVIPAPQKAIAASPSNPASSIAPSRGERTSMTPIVTMPATTEAMPNR